MTAIPFPIPRDEARKDLAHAKLSIARYERREARLLAQLADVRADVAEVRRMVRTIVRVYPDLADDAATQGELLTEVADA